MKPGSLTEEQQVRCDKIIASIKDECRRYLDLKYWDGDEVSKTPPFAGFAAPIDFHRNVLNENDPDGRESIDDSYHEWLFSEGLNGAWTIRFFVHGDMWLCEGPSARVALNEEFWAVWLKREFEECHGISMGEEDEVLGDSFRDFSE